MAPTERMREVLASPLTASDLERRAGEGWSAVAVIWERKVAEDQAPPPRITEPVPYGLKISEDCLSLEEDIHERDALLAMMEMIIQDKPLPEVAESLNQRGFRTRQRLKWTPGTVFDMLPRLIEVGPRVFTSEEWVVRRGRLMNVV